MAVISSFKQRRQKYNSENEKECKTKGKEESDFSEPTFQKAVPVEEETGSGWRCCSRLLGNCLPRSEQHCPTAVRSVSVNTPILNLELQKYLPEKQLLGHFVPNSHLLEDSPRPPSYSFMAFSYSLLASSALRSHS